MPNLVNARGFRVHNLFLVSFDFTFPCIKY
jgi:hypothetical protein